MSGKFAQDGNVHCEIFTATGRDTMCHALWLDYTSQQHFGRTHVKCYIILAGLLSLSSSQSYPKSGHIGSRFLPQN